MIYKDRKPSVTELTGLLNKPALMKWANKIGLQGIALDQYQKNSLNEGGSMHEQIESWLKHKTPFSDLEFQGRFEDFMQDKEMMDCEKPVENEWFTGRFDLKYRINGEVWIVDFKSNQRGIYLENKLQLAAYRMAEGCHKVAIVGIPDMNIITPVIEDFRPYEKCLTLLSQLYPLVKWL